MVLAVFASSCETYDDYDETRDPVAGFTLANRNFKVPTNGTSTKTVDIFVSDIADTDRTFTVQVVQEGTEVAPENYSFDPTIVIPANENTFTFTLTGTDVSLTEEKTPLIMEIVPTDGVVSGSPITWLLFI